ncbi:MAG: D-alanine--D-alanine ligase [Gammaproteobacteria bacterium]
MEIKDRLITDAFVIEAGHVGVLMGGNSAEREISLETGAHVISCLKESGVNATPIDWNGKLSLSENYMQYDRIFIATHGIGGEDGKIQSVLELLDIPYTGTKVLGCALAMDKIRAKLVWSGLDLSTPSFEVIDYDTDSASLVKKIGLPLIVKPARGGSSFGITIVDDISQLVEAISHAKKFDSLVIAESYITGEEYTVSILLDEALPAIKIKTPRAFYDFEAKYRSESTEYICPCELQPEAEEMIQEIALEAFAALGGSGWGRIDFMKDEYGKFWLIEMNTVPGLTSHSLFPMSVHHSGKKITQAVLSILSSSMTNE